MKDVLLALCVGLAFALGYLPMRRLDRFLEKNREAGERAPRENHRRAEGRRLSTPRLRRGKLSPLRHEG